MLTGKFARTIDEKLRLAIPKTLRSALGEGAGERLYITPGTDKSLAIYTEASLARLAERLAASSPNRQDVRAFSRLFYAQAQAVEIDAQARIRISPELAKLAQIDKEVVILGVSDHLEIWDRFRWEQYQDEQQPRYDEIAEAAFDPPH